MVGRGLLNVGGGTGGGGIPWEVVTVPEEVPNNCPENFFGGGGGGGPPGLALSALLLPSSFINEALDPFFFCNVPVLENPPGLGFRRGGAGKLDFLTSGNSAWLTGGDLWIKKTIQ